MTHSEQIIDKDPVFNIDDVTRQILNPTSSEIAIVQFDHNSERFTFRLNRHIEGHDMTKCNRIEVHYKNIDASTLNESLGVYEVTDLHVDPDDETKAICTWLVSNNATQKVGKLDFLLRFSCVEPDGNIIYAWNTSIFTGIMVSAGLYNSEEGLAPYLDVLAQWKTELFGASAEGVENIFTARENSLKEVNTAREDALTEINKKRQLAVNSITVEKDNSLLEIEQKRKESVDEISNVEEDVHAAHSTALREIGEKHTTAIENIQAEEKRVEDSLQENYVELLNTANAIRGTASGEVVAITDISPIKHTMDVKVTGIDNPENVTVTRRGKNLLGIETIVTNNVDGVNVTFDYDKQELTLDGKVTDSSGISTIAITSEPIIKKGNTYTFSLKHISGEYINVGETNSIVIGGNVEYRINLSRNARSITRLANFDESEVCLFFTSEGAEFKNYKFVLQVEEGDTATEYEPYTCETYTPNADGTVEGVTSLYPNTTLLTDAGAVIECEYNKDTNKAIKNTLNESGNLTDEQLANVDKIPTIEAEQESIKAELINKVTAEYVTSQTEPMWHSILGLQGTTESLNATLDAKQDKLSDGQMEHINALPHLGGYLQEVINEVNERITDEVSKLDGKINSPLELLYEGTTTEEVSTISVTADREGNVFELDELLAWVKMPNPNNISPNVYFTDGIACYGSAGGLGTSNMVIITSWNRNHKFARIEQYNYYYSFRTATMKEVTNDVTVNQFRMQVFGDSVFPVGTEVKVWGKKVQA